MSAGTRAADRQFMSLLPMPTQSVSYRFRPVARRLVRCGRITVVEGMIVRVVR